MRLTHNGYLDEVTVAVGMDEAAVTGSGPELEENVTRVPHVEARQVDGGVGFPEGDCVVVYICGGAGRVRVRWGTATSN